LLHRAASAVIYFFAIIAIINYQHCAAITSQRVTFITFISIVTIGIVTFCTFFKSSP
jgi:hypothetical protein